MDSNGKMKYSISLGAIITRADGTVEDLGEIVNTRKQGLIARLGRKARINKANRNTLLKRR